MFVRTTLAVVAAAVIIQTGSAFAQSGPPPPPPAGASAHHERHGMGRLFKSLNLSDAQKAQMKTIHQKYRTQNQNVTDPQQRHANMKAERNEMMGVLTPDQKQKFQTALQQMRQRHSQGAPGAPHNGPGPSGTPLP